MKKLILILLLGVVSVACESRYEFDYSLKYTVGDKQFTETGTVVTTDPHSVPIAVAYQNSVVLDTYPTRVIENKTVVIYQGETPAQIDSLGYRLNQYYEYNKASGRIWNRTRVIKEENR